MILLDSNILVRLVNSDDPQREAALDALQRLRELNEELVIAPQCLYEFWVVSTRPAAARGGLGRTTEETGADIEEFLRSFRLIDDAGLFVAWFDLVRVQGISGTAAHDARLVAFMKRSDVSAILTFNTDDFVRFDGIQAINPEQAGRGKLPNTPLEA